MLNNKLHLAVKTSNVIELFHDRLWTTHRIKILPINFLKSHALLLRGTTRLSVFPFSLHTTMAAQIEKKNSVVLTTWSRPTLTYRGVLTINSNHAVHYSSPVCCLSKKWSVKYSSVLRITATDQTSMVIYSINLLLLLYSCAYGTDSSTYEKIEKILIWTGDSGKFEEGVCHMCARKRWGLAIVIGGVGVCASRNY